MYRLLWVLAAGAGVGLSLRESPGIDRVGWLAGCWEARSGSRTIEEQWSAPRGGTMLGTSRTLRADTTVGWEMVLLRSDSSGLAYEAHPSGQAGATFRSIDVSDSLVVFANPHHDFPQKVIYRRRADSLLARIEGTVNGRTRAVDFPYARVACPGRG